MQTDVAGLPPEIAEQAADWIVLLSYGTPAERKQARAEFEAWQQRDPSHAEAAARLHSVLGRMDDIRAATDGRTEPAQAALKSGLQTKQRMRRAVTVGLSALCLVLAGWLATQAFPPAALTADLRTASGEWQSHVLEDGTRLTLAGGSAVNLHFSAERRSIELVDGNILIDVAHDAARPFVVDTAEADIRALGTRFIVDRHRDTTTLSMLESDTLVRTAHGKDHLIVHAGQRLRIDGDGLGTIETVNQERLESAWNRHQLVVSARPVPQILDELDRYHSGRIFYDADQLQDIRMTAVLPLEDTGQALQLLANSVPGLRIRRLTPYLVMVDRPAGDH
ncbi:hypothetical protein GCM10007205_07840 [Oxalicibacterium flavum]|uniref:Histidine kinase n=1 Tax=Oxalicibacterium flavum TaxID=179467 RepID=A0A8J2XXJ5_9BURK|nr:FecR domain-containing protein [Oxalicibacterium flavum]GGC01015.1 hypothetical protein GCM10007205_07840 [Oxalicibacterium flavum]